MRIEGISVFNCTTNEKGSVVRDVGFSENGKPLGMVFPYPDVALTNTVHTTCPYLRENGVYEHVEYTFGKDSNPAPENGIFKGCRIICNGHYCDRRK